jgi:hypothetical protein
MRSVERLMRVALLALVAYSAVVLVDVGHERFPIFSWSLFSKVPASTKQDYSVRFTEIDGKPIDPPMYFASLRGTLASAGSPQAYSLMRQLGSYLDSGRPRVDLARALFEETYLTDIESAQYEVVFRRFDIKDRFECERAGRDGSSCYLEERVVGAYTLGR